MSQMFNEGHELSIETRDTPDGVLWSVSLDDRFLAALDNYAERNGFVDNSDAEPLRSRLLALAHLIVALHKSQIAGSVN